MDEELVQNVAMGEKFVKNFVMDLPTFKIGGICSKNLLRKMNYSCCLFEVEADIPRDALRVRVEATA